ncbi:MAG: hypothetical protein HAW66_02755 [Shewanella sp.]|nr:hypothetical protein [Shewanella sp.]
MVATYPSASKTSFRALEQLTTRRSEDSSVIFRLHKMNGKTQDYQVSYHEGRAVECKRNKGWHSYFTSRKEAIKQMSLVHFLNQKDTLNVPCVIKVTNDYDAKFPKNKNEWLDKANDFVSKENPALTLLLDLDDTLFSLTKTPHFTFKLNMNIVNIPNHFVNKDAMEKIAAFQRRHHRIKVITNANYPYINIAGFFKYFNITLPEADYFNRDHPARCKLTKQEFIERYAFNKSCLLVDDKLKNGSRSTHFHHAYWLAPFPDLSCPTYV